MGRLEKFLVLFLLEAHQQWVWKELDCAGGAHDFRCEACDRLVASLFWDPS